MFWTLAELTNSQFPSFDVKSDVTQLGPGVTLNLSSNRMYVSSKSIAGIIQLWCEILFKDKDKVFIFLDRTSMSVTGIELMCTFRGPILLGCVLFSLAVWSSNVIEMVELLFMICLCRL